MTLMGGFIYLPSLDRALMQSELILHALGILPGVFSGKPENLYTVINISVNWTVNRQTLTSLG